MLEWVAFNRAIGFTDFLIYTNDCADGTDAIAARLDRMGLAQHRENAFGTGGRPQGAALKAAMKEPVYRQADWLICADCDEFLNIRVGAGHLDDLFAATGISTRSRSAGSCSAMAGTCTTPRIWSPNGSRSAAASTSFPITARGA